MRRAYVPLSCSSEQYHAGRARSLNLQNRRRPDLLLPPAWYFDRRRRLDDRQRVLQGSLPSVADGVCRRSAKAAECKPGRECRISLRFWTREGGNPFSSALPRRNLVSMTGGQARDRAHVPNFSFEHVQVERFAV